MSQEFRGQPMRDLRGYLLEAQVKQLIRGTLNFRNKVFIRLLWVTGARVSEIVGDKSWYKNRVYEPARVNDIDWTEGIIVLNLLKRKQYPPPKHRVPLDKITLTMLKEYVTQEELKDDDVLFSFTRRRALQIINEAGQAIGILKVGEKKLHNHHLRHSHCVAYIRKNNTVEGLRKLQKRIGHASISTTAEYLQFGTEQKQETEDIFGKW